MRAGLAPRLEEAAEPQDDQAGAVLRVLADISLTLGLLKEQAQRAERRQLALLNAVFPVSVPSQVDQVTSGGALVVADPERLGPRNGFCWDVRRVTVAGLASSSESVTLYRGSTGSSADFVRQNTITTLTGPTGTFSPGLGALWLRAGESIVIQGTSLTANENVYTIVDAIAVAEPWVGAYLL